jgi:hypothetical protein
MEVVDIGLNDIDTPMNIRFSDESSSSSGMGIEMLMNDKHRSNSGINTNVDLGDLDKMESELNDITAPRKDVGGETKFLSGFSNMFGYGNKSTESRSAGHTQENINLSTDEDGLRSNVGHATAESVSGNTRTWDGYQQASDPAFEPSGSTSMSDRERRRKKRHMLKKLDEWYDKGHIKSNSRFTLESSYEDIEDEYETAVDDKRKKDAVKLQGWWLMSFVNAIEYGNAALDPFGLNIDGWGEKVGEDLDDYEEIFSELHDKYKGGKLSPELSLLLRLGFSAAVVNITNKAFSTATPGYSEIIKQNPDLMKAFSNATVQMMSEQNPVFGMANGMMNKEPETNSTFGPPPAPVKTRTQEAQPRPGSMTYTQHPGNRPDLTAANNRPMFRDQGIDINDGKQKFEAQQYSSAPAPPPRAEMRGPNANVDINNILSGLKSRTTPVSRPEREVLIHTDTNTGDNSLISIGSINDINSTTLPKRASRRKQKSDKNIMTLDI